MNNRKTGSKKQEAGIGVDQGSIDHRNDGKDNGSRSLIPRQLFEEITDHLCSDQHPSAYINGLLKKDGFDVHPFSMLKKLEVTPQSPVHHPEGCVWNHVALVVDQAAQVRHLSYNPKVFMWAALLHDIGKGETTRTRKGRIVSYDHDTVGMNLAINFLTELTDDDSFIQQVSKLVKYHMHPLYVNKSLPFGDVKGMKAETDMHETALLGYCDRMGRLGCKTEEEKANIKEFLERCGVDVTLSL
ncbi:HDIG domain-containing metalloprotein [Anaerotignum sp. MB30-C6]|uniref:HDIG domain-containing metalloprotein n=1 Tax=Anaerotignum sp. MB30-C6 TaxID=3070814 RepID=UPI0027DC36C3|nr:HDIG domain-containing metalloprotein [Anaerotignum sp. MB30-C6]WMI79807.1 HDIG domain-containing protein [Anaerotignum sp. MB30-C6]